MLHHYLKVAFRSFRRYLGYSVINVVGLGVGLAACALIFLYIEHELSYDEFHNKSDRIYRILIQDTNRGAPETSATLPVRVTPGLEKSVPQIRGSARISDSRGETYVSSNGGEGVFSTEVLEAEPSFFELFDFPIVRGRAEGLLGDPSSAAVTRSMAHRLFGTTEVVGREITIDETTYRVDAVLRDPPSFSQFQFEVLTPLQELDVNGWNYRSNQGYVLVETGTRPSDLDGAIESYVRAHAHRNTTPEETEPAPEEYALSLQALTDVHLGSGFVGPAGKTAGSTYLILFALGAVLILLIAVVNYVNLSTATASVRIREVAVRKAYGADRGQLITQFVGEAVLTAGVALLLGTGLFAFGLPLVESILGHPLDAARLIGPSHIAVGVGGVLLVGLVSGCYPAFYAVRHREGLAGQADRGPALGGATLRKGLVVFQFAISAGLLLAAGVTYQQLEHVRSERLDVAGEQVVVIPNRLNQSRLNETYRVLKDRLVQHTAIRAVASGEPPGQVSMTMSYTSDEGPRTHLNVISVGDGYVETLGLPLIEGRGFRSIFDSSGTQQVLINEQMAEWLRTTRGYEELIGHRVPEANGTVMGIVGRFHVESLYEPIRPLIMKRRTDRVSAMLVRFEQGRVASGLDRLRSVWDDVGPPRPLNFRFLDEQLDEAYRAEIRMARLFGGFSGIAVLLGCLGLVGLAAFTIRRREKEISIRKVLGATISSLLALLSRDFVRLVAMAVLIGLPPAYLGMRSWLQDFAYRVEIGWGILAAATAVVLGLALLAVSYHALRAAWTNPAESLRYE